MECNPHALCTIEEIIKCMPTSTPTHTEYAYNTGMKRLAWILGLIALCSSAFLSISGFIAHRGVEQAAEDVSNWQMVAALQVDSDSTKIRTDELKIQTDESRIETAKLQGKSPAKDEAMLSADRSLLSLDEDTQRMHQSTVFGRNPQADAAQHSLDVYTSVLARDYHLAYATALVWLAFGFAVALSAKQRRLQRIEEQ